MKKFTSFIVAMVMVVLLVGTASAGPIDWLADKAGYVSAEKAAAEKAAAEKMAAEKMAVIEKAAAERHTTDLAIGGGSGAIGMFILMAVVGMFVVRKTITPTTKHENIQQHDEVLV